MAEETVVKEMLSPEIQEAGKNLLKKLDNLSLYIRAALWFYIPEKNLWRLLFATPLVKQGTTQVYKKIQDVLTESDEIKNTIHLNDISVIEDDDPLISLLNVAISTGAQDINGIRFSKNTINGQFIEDAYIYRMTSPAHYRKVGRNEPCPCGSGKKYKKCHGSSN